MFVIGLVFGLIATGVNFLMMYFAVRWMMRRQSSATRLLTVLSYVLRYFVFGALIYLFLRFRLGTAWGLFAGVTVGIIGYLVWQLVNNARNRRSS
jgi:phage shock protein PspC (stress-responsive transcriptional regulator)